MKNNLLSVTIQQHSAVLYGFAMKFTKNVDDAQDLLQDTMMKAIRYADKFEEGSNMKAWLFTIMRNTFINNYRQNQKTQVLIVQSDGTATLNMSYSAARNQAENKFVMGDIKLALSQLPAYLSVPFVRYVEGYKYHEIAHELDIPLGTVKTHIHEARKQLRKMLQMYKTDKYN